MPSVDYLRYAPPIILTPPSSSGSATSLVMNTGNIKWAVPFKPPVLTPIRYFGFAVSSTTGTPVQYQVSVYAAGTDGKPTGSPLASATFTPPGPTSWNNTFQYADLGSGNEFTPSAGTAYFMVIEPVGTPDASNFLTIQAGQNQIGGRYGQPHYLTSTDGGSTWSRQSSGAGVPPHAWKTASRTYGIPWRSFFVGRFANNTNLASGGDERGLQFSIPDLGQAGTYKVAGVGFIGRMGAASTTFDVTLYDGTTVRQAITVDSDLAQAQNATDYQLFEYMFDDDEVDDLYDCVLGNNYILALKANNASQEFSLHGIELAAAADRSAFGFGTNGLWVYREDAGAWSNLDTRVPWMWPIIKSIDVPDGGGGGGADVMLGSRFNRGFN